MKWMTWFLNGLNGRVVGNTIKTPNGIAVLMISSGDDYLQLVGPKTRNMIRKATKLKYTSRIFDSGDFLSDIKDIWTSTPIRSGQPMSSAYSDEPARFEESFGCSSHYTFGFGVFQGSALVAYAKIAKLGEIGIVVQVLGHKDYLKDGIMNLLFSDLQTFLYKSGVAKLLYLRMKSSTTNLESFKKHVGFSSDSITLRHRLNKTERRLLEGSYVKTL